MRPGSIAWWCAELAQVNMTQSGWVLIALGSNVGDSPAIVGQAMDDLESLSAGEYRRSSLWRTTAVDCPPDSPDFINAAVAFAAPDGLTPEKLLYQLKRMEREAGRQLNQVRHAPRPLDLDLLLFGDESRCLPWFHLPHPRALGRRFVLAPAAEVLPQQVWPGEGASIEALLAELDAEAPSTGPVDAVERLCAAAKKS